MRARRDHLQRINQSMRDGHAVGAGVANLRIDAVEGAQAGRHDLQCVFERTWTG